MTELVIKGTPTAGSAYFQSAFETMIQSTLTTAGAAWYSQIEPVACRAVENYINTDVDWESTELDPIIKYALLQLVLSFYISQAKMDTAGLKSYSEGDISMTWAESLKAPQTWREMLDDYRQNPIGGVGRQITTIFPIAR